MTDDQERKISQKLDELDHTVQHSDEKHERESAFTLAFILRLYLDLRDEVRSFRKELPTIIASQVTELGHKREERRTHPRKDLSNAPLSDRAIEWVRVFIKRDPKMAMVLMMVAAPYLPFIGPVMSKIKVQYNKQVVTEEGIIPTGFSVVRTNGLDFLVMVQQDGKRSGGM